MAAKKKKGKTTAKKPGTAKAKKAVKKAAKKASKPAKKAAKKAAPKKAKAAPKKAKAAPKAKKKADTKTRAQALQEARKKVPLKGKTPRIGKRSIVSELSQTVISAYAGASRELAELLAAARRADRNG